MNILNKTFLIAPLLLAIIPSTRAMEEALEERKEQSRTHELAKAVVENDFDRYFALLAQELPQIQRSLCNITLDTWANRALHGAAFLGNIKAIERLIALGASVNERNVLGMTPFLCAVKSGNIHAVTVLLGYGADKHATTDDFCNALHVAASEGHADLIKALIVHHGFDPNSALPLTYYTPLHKAANNGHCEAVKALIAHGAEKDARDRGDNNALHIAIKRGDISLIITLIKDLGFPTIHQERTLLGRPALSLLRFIRVLAKHECLVHFALLCCGAEMSDIEKQNICIGNLRPLSVGPVYREALCRDSLAPWDVSIVDEHHWTPLIKATASLCEPCVNLLLKDKRVDVNVQDDAGRTALHYAALTGDQEIIALLLNYQRTNVSIKNNAQESALDHVKKALNDTLSHASHKERLNSIVQLFALRKMKVQAYLSLKNARCTEQCSETACPHGPHLPADICMKIARSLTIDSLPLQPKSK